jgi:hypothetical protein
VWRSGFSGNGRGERKKTKKGIKKASKKVNWKPEG